MLPFSLLWQCMMPLTDETMKVSEPYSRTCLVFSRRGVDAMTFVSGAFFTNFFVFEPR
jgi:hypothetical protein